MCCAVQGMLGMLLCLKQRKAYLMMERLNAYVARRHISLPCLYMRLKCYWCNCFAAISVAMLCPAAGRRNRPQAVSPLPGEDLSTDHVAATSSRKWWTALYSQCSRPLWHTDEEHRREPQLLPLEVTGDSLGGCAGPTAESFAQSAEGRSRALPICSCRWTSGTPAALDTCWTHTHGWGRTSSRPGRRSRSKLASASSGRGEDTTTLCTLCSSSLKTGFKINSFSRNIAESRWHCGTQACSALTGYYRVWLRTLR